MKRLDKLHQDHREASREHAAWIEDVERWRTSYQEALLACARRLASGLELDNFEAALDRHEAAIHAHEDAIRRHEKALHLGPDGKLGRSEDSIDFHRLMGERHDRSRLMHEQLERSHKAVLAALEMIGRR